MPKLFIAICVVALCGAGCEKMPPCLKSHQETRHGNAWVQFIPVYKGMMIPIFHPARDYQVDVCDEYATSTSAMFPSKIKNNCPYTVDVTSMEEALVKKCLVSE